MLNLSLSQVDERIPPMVDDFLYVCDDAYSRCEIVAIIQYVVSPH